VTDNERRQVWLAVIERIHDLSIALHTTLESVRVFPADSDECLAVTAALDQLDAAISRFQASKGPRLVASGWQPGAARGR